MTLEEAKAELRTEGTLLDTGLAICCGIATGLLESECNRHFFINHDWDPSGDTDEPYIVEGHDLDVRQSSIFVMHRPIRRLKSISIMGTTLGAETLVVDADAGMVAIKGRTTGIVGLGREPYPVGPFGPDFPEDYYQRLGGGWFPAGNGLVEVQYLGGFAKTADVPGDLKHLCLDVLARIWRDQERKTQGITLQQTNLGMVSKYGDDFLPKYGARILMPYRNVSRTAARRAPIGEPSP